MTAPDKLVDIKEDNLVVVAASADNLLKPGEFANNTYEIRYGQRRSKRFLNKLLLFMMYVPILLSFGAVVAKKGLAGLVDVQHWPAIAFALCVPIIAYYLLSFMERLSTDFRIRLSRDGISFSRSWAFELLNRTRRSWEDVHSVQLIESHHARNSIASTWELMRVSGVDPTQIKWTKDGYYLGVASLQIDFKSGGNASIVLNLLTKEQIRCLFLSLEHWLDGDKMSRDTVKLKHALISDFSGDTSYTDVWMEDLELRYATTNFDPLPADHSLQSGNFVIVSTLSSRGQTAVYLGVDRDGNKVIVKEMVSPAVSHDARREKAREMFHREAALLARLKHPHISSIIDHFVENERDYVVLEYIAGRTLRQLVKMEGKQAPDNVRNWAIQLLTILEDLHEMDPPIIHRDITPDNLVLQIDGQLAVIDFGAANEFLGNATGTLVGKQCYVSPEQFRGKITPAADIYSAGCTIYFLLTGRDPTPLSQSRPAADDTSVPHDLDEFAARCTDLDEQSRFKSASEAKHALKVVSDK